MAPCPCLPGCLEQWHWWGSPVGFLMSPVRWRHPMVVCFQPPHSIPQASRGPACSLCSPSATHKPIWLAAPTQIPPGSCGRWLFPDRHARGDSCCQWASQLLDALPPRRPPRPRQQPVTRSTAQASGSVTQHGCLGRGFRDLTAAR